MQKPSLNPGCLQALQGFLQTIPVLEGALRCKIGSPREKWALKNLSPYVGNHLKQFGGQRDGSANKGAAAKPKSMSSIPGATS